MEIKTLTIAKGDYQEAKDYIKNRLFNLGFCGLTNGKVEPKSIDVSRFLELTSYAVENGSLTSYVECFRGVYGDDYKDIESNMIKTFQRLSNNIFLTPKRIFNILMMEVFKEWGEFYD